MNIKTLATLAAAVIATSAYAGHHEEAKCGAGSCGKKEMSDKKKAKGAKAAASGASAAEHSCGKKEKEASCGKKDKEATCGKK
ncbi:MAG: hypothetical protein RLZZ182_240 [Pseudomonadota bacterium]